MKIGHLGRTATTRSKIRRAVRKRLIYYAVQLFYTRSPGEKEGGKEREKERKGEKKERERENTMNKLAIESIACLLVDAS